MAITQTAIGRVIPAYVGEWVDNRQYNKLDNVEYLGSTYIALRDNISIEPTGSSAVGVWSLLASKGNSGRIAGAVGTAVRSDEAWVSIITSGDPTDINLEFSFGLPKGDTGAPAAFANVFAAAQSVTSDRLLLLRLVLILIFQNLVVMLLARLMVMQEQVEIYQYMLFLMEEIRQKPLLVIQH